MTKLPTQNRRGKQRRCWCGTGECWGVECDTCCKGVARPSTCLAIIQAMSNSPGYFPRLLLWVVLPHSMDGRSVSPSQLCRERRVTGQEETPSAALWKGAGLHPPCLGAGAGAIRVNIPSREGNSHRFFLGIWNQKIQTRCAANCFGHFLSFSVTFSEGYPKIRKRSITSQIISAHWVQCGPDTQMPRSWMLTDS